MNYLWKIIAFFCASLSLSCFADVSNFCKNLFIICWISWTTDLSCETSLIAEFWRKKCFSFCWSWFIFKFKENQKKVEDFAKVLSTAKVYLKFCFLKILQMIVVWKIPSQTSFIFHTNFRYFEFVWKPWNTKKSANNVINKAKPIIFADIFLPFTCSN